MKALEVRGVCKRFGGTLALDGVDFSVEEGELCVLLGPSGCGKSTLLRCVAGLEEPDRGEVWIRGRRVDGLDPRERNVAMVFQSYALYPHMSVRGNLSFPLRMRGVARAERERRVRETARLLRIEDLLDRRPAALSGGQRQRVALGRAIVRDPDLFLLDEPLSNLDAKLRARMRVEIAALRRRLGAAIVHVTHDQVEAMSLGRRIVVLHEGRVEQAGPPAAIYGAPATRFVAGFVGSPPMNFFEGSVGDAGFEGCGIRLPLRSAHRGPATLGVRPEDLLLDAPQPRGEGRVEWVEDLGSDLYAHLRVGDLLLVARLGPEDPAREGRAAAFAVREGGAHLFGPDGRRLDVGVAAGPAGR